VLGVCGGEHGEIFRDLILVSRELASHGDDVEHPHIRINISIGINIWGQLFPDKARGISGVVEELIASFLLFSEDGVREEVGGLAQYLSFARESGSPLGERGTITINRNAVGGVGEEMSGAEDGGVELGALWCGGGRGVPGGADAVEEGASPHEEVVVVSIAINIHIHIHG